MRELAIGLALIIIIFFIIPNMFETHDHSQYSKGNNSPVINANGGDVTINQSYKDEEIILSEIKELKKQLEESNNLENRSIYYLQEQSYQFQEKIQEKKFHGLTSLEKENFDPTITKWIQCLEEAKLAKNFHEKEIIHLLQIRKKHNEIKIKMASCEQKIKDYNNQDQNELCYGNFIYTRLEQALNAEEQCDYITSRIIYIDLLENYDTKNFGLHLYLTENKTHIENLINSKITDADYSTMSINKYDSLNFEAHDLKYHGKSFEAIEKYREAESLFESPEKEEETAQLHERIGDLYFHEPDFSRARDEYWRTLELREEIRNKNDTIDSWINYLLSLDKLAESFFFTNDYSLALQYYQESARTANIMIKSNKYYEKILIDYLQMRAYVKIGDINFYQGYEDESPPYYKLAINIAKNYVMDDELFKLIYSIAEKYKELGEKYKNRKKKLMALDAYLESLRNFEMIIGFSSNAETNKKIKLNIAWNFYFIFMMENKKNHDHLKQARKILMELSTDDNFNKDEKKLLNEVQKNLNKLN